jgi:hypothetical protein
MFYEEVFRKLRKRKVRYVVAGGIALVLPINLIDVFVDEPIRFGEIESIEDEGE